MKIKIKTIQSPMKDNSKEPVQLTKKTIIERKNKVLSRMKKYNFSSIFIYADKEHGGSFEYLTGFIPRFEEGLLVLNVDGTSELMLGNENYNKIEYSLIGGTGILVPLFSLPNQPMGDFKPLDFYLKKIKVDTSQKIGLIDWKLLSKDFEDETKISSIPSFIVDSIHKCFGKSNIVNATGLMIDPAVGARVTNNANEIARYEYGASLSSDSILDAMNHLKVGVSELEIGDNLQKMGQYPNVVSISSFGKRFKNANIYPTSNHLKLGDPISLTVSHKGGLSSRAGVAVHTLVEMESLHEGYLNDFVIPYYEAYIYWLENIRIGSVGGEFYEKFNKFFPQKKYGWELNPGHLTADEEWLCSPFFDGSNATVQSGMIFAVDFIPIKKEFSGVSAESTVVLADDLLRKEIESEYPEMWERIIKRKKYLKDVIGLELSEEILPLTSTLAYYRPFMLNSNIAFVLEK